LRRTAFGGEEVVLATVRDITEQRRSDAALRDSRQILEGVLNAIPVRVFWKDKNLVYLGCNRPFARDAGFKEPAELIGKDDFQMGWRDQAEIYRKDDLEVIASGMAKPFIEEPQTTPDGRTITLLTTKVPLRAPDGGIGGILGVYMDITERKRAEEALRASEAELSEAQRLAKLGSWSWIPRDDKVTWSGELYSILGLDPARPPPNVAEQAKVLTERSYREMRRALARILRERRPHAIDLEFKRPDGTGGWLLARGEAECDSAGHVTCVRGTVLDITERKQAEQALAYRDRVQHAVTAAAAYVVGGDTLSQGVERALETVGEALGVDRVIVLEGPGVGRPPTLRHTWQRAGIQPMTQEMLFASGIAGTPEEAEWMAPALRNQPVVTDRQSAGAAIRNMMTRFGIQSILTVPVLTAGRFWGMIGVDVCREPRQWTAAEIETLQTFAEVLGVVIMRQGDLESLRRSEERFRAVSETAQDAIILLDSAGRIEFWNPAAERILGHVAADAIGRELHQLIAPEAHRDRVRSGLDSLIRTGTSATAGRTMEFSALRGDGDEVPVEVSVATMRLGTERHAVAVLRDISERKRAEAQIARMARYDALTGLANRSVFVEGLQRSIAAARRSGKQFAVLYLDLDHFKDVNDTLGHPMGDRLLKGVGERLQAGIRESDIVARFGGDEFAVIQTDIETPEEAALLADRLVRALAEPFALAGNEVRTGASIGIAVYGADSPDAESLLSHADVALYRAKSEGRGTWRFFTTAMDDEVRARVALGGELRSAIASGQLFLEYQPQVDARSGHIVGVEALVRWNHPVRGIIGPALFVPVAESSGSIVPLGRWVLGEACRQARLWLDSGVQVPLMAVNVSARQFKTPLELEQDIDDVLRRTGFPAERLELELTESVLIEASREHNDALIRLRQKGIRLAVDDFGTGYSSLDYLRRFPVHRIKIAQTFVTTLTETSSTAAIVKAAIGLAHELNLDVVVEGVETARQFALVSGWGGNQIQGFYFSRPLPAAEIEPLLRAGHVAPADRAAGHAAAAG
jgi:diguanylate cyclase (GGDEF)-like protein/PAS domain S-box-containing protein